MKKIMTLAAIFAAVMMGISSCNPDDTKPEQKPDTEQGGENNGGEQGGENNGGEEGGENNGGEQGGENTEPTAAITIDGDFADWDALDATKVAVATNNSETTGGLKVLKVYADEAMLNIYVELDPEFVTCRCSANPCEHGGEPGNPLDLFFSTSKERGGYNAFSDLCVEYFVQGTLFEDGEFTSWDGGMYMWSGEVHAEGWTWEQVLESVQATGAGAGDKYEIGIFMDILGGVMDLSDKLYIGAVIEQAWDIAGVLPNAAVTDDNTSGKAEMLEVIINK